MQVNWIENDSVINSMRRKQVMSQNWPFQLHLSDCTQHRSTCNLQKLDWNCFLCCQLTIMDSNAKSQYTGCVSNLMSRGNPSQIYEKWEPWIILTLSTANSLRSVDTFVTDYRIDSIVLRSSCLTLIHDSKWHDEDEAREWRRRR